jgi:hypothetical protein
MPSFRLPSLVLAALTVLTVSASAQMGAVAPLPAAPILLRWPEPSFEPARQCHGQYALQDLERFLPRARVGLRLPGTRAVALDQGRHCIAVTVDDVGGGRLVELLLRGVSVPRSAVLLELAEPPRS